MTALPTYAPQHHHIAQSVQDIAHAHLLWLQSAGQQGKRANFRGADLKGQVFKGLNFSQASFRNAALHGVQFVECNLEEADFAEADIGYGHFEACHMKLANFSRAQLHNATLVRCAMEKSVFLQAMLEMARIDNVNLREANFREAAMPGVHLCHTELQRATFRNVTATRARFEYVRFDGVEAKEARFDYTSFVHVAWYGAILRGASFDNATCDNSDISAAEEVDASAVAAIEKTMAQVRAEEFKNIEKLQSHLSDTKRILDQRTDGLLHREKKLFEREQAWLGLQRDLSRGGEKVRSRALLLRIIAASWWMISAMVATIMVHQYLTVGIGGLNMVEVGVVTFATLFLMSLFIASATITYRASRQLWAVIDRLEDMQSDQDA